MLEQILKKTLNTFTEYRSPPFPLRSWSYRIGLCRVAIRNEHDDNETFLDWYGEFSKQPKYLELHADFARIVKIKIKSKTSTPDGLVHLSSMIVS